MSAIQRERLDAQLRGTGVGSEQSVSETRDNFAKLMNALPVPEGIRVEETSLGGRPALRISPDAAAGSGTLLYLHGGSHVAGSPGQRSASPQAWWSEPGFPASPWTTGWRQSTRSRQTSRTWSPPTASSSNRGTRPSPSPWPATPPAAG